MIPRFEFLFGAARRARGLCVVLPVLPLMAAGAAGSEPSVPNPDSLIAKLVEDSQKHRRVRRVGRGDALFEAEIESAELAGDVSEYSRYLRLIMTGYARRSLWDEAEYLTTRMIGGGVPLGLAELALSAAKAGRVDDSVRLAGRALAELHLAQGIHKDKVRRDCAITFHLAGKPELADALHQALPADDQFVVAAAALKAADTLLPKAAEVRSLLEQTKPAAHAGAAYVLACADKALRAGDRETGRVLLNLAGETAAHPKFQTAMEVLLDVARIAHRHGLATERDKAANLFMAYAQSVADGMEWKPLCCTQLAGLLLEWGQGERAEQALASAEQAVPQVLILYAPESMIAIAEVHEKLGHHAVAEAWMLKAAQTGAANAHPRARGMSGVRICLHYGERNRPLPEAIKTVLAQAKGNGAS